MFMGTVDQSSTDTIVQADANPLESGLKALWDRVKRAGEVIVSLRSDNAQLKTRVDDLERELRRLQSELQKKDQVLQETTARRAEGESVFSNGERDALIVRVKDLLSRIEAYL